MKAFYRVDDTLIKVYDQGDDWQVIAGENEYWFSTWQGGKEESFIRAIKNTCQRVGIVFKSENIVHCS